MYALDRGSRIDSLLRPEGEQPSAFDHEARPETFAASEHGMPHGRPQPFGSPPKQVSIQQCRQPVLDQAGCLGQSMIKRHGTPQNFAGWPLSPAVGSSRDNGWSGPKNVAIRRLLTLPPYVSWRPICVGHDTRVRLAIRPPSALPNVGAQSRWEFDVMAVPRKKVSRMKRGFRRSADALRPEIYVEDKDSGNLRRPHHIDLKSGKYRGRQILEGETEI